MKKKILLTRPRVASERWSALAAACGFDGVIEPLLTIVPTREARPSGVFQAVMITSANAPDALEDLRINMADLLPLPCFCVGEATGIAARVIGFTDIRCGASDSAALARHMIAALPDKTRPLLHIAGEAVDGKARDILAQNGFTLTSWPVYRADATEDFTPATRDFLASGQCAAIPVFSPRSAAILVALIEKNRLTQACSGILAVGLSQAVVDVLKTLPWRRLRVAASPSSEAVLAILQTELSMTQNLSSLPPEPTPPKGGRKKNYLVWGLLGIVLLAGGSAIALSHCPWLNPAAPTLNIGALEKRIDNLETRLNNLPAAPAGASDAALADTVKNLQAQIALLQNQGSQNQQTARKWIAAALAFQDVREAAKAGQSFAEPLANLRSAAGNDTVIAEQAAKLEPFAAGVPALAQLRDELKAQESSIAPPIARDADASLWERIKIAFQPLISVRALPHPQFVALEETLASGDAQAALDHFKTLPPETQKNLSGWQSKLEARMEMDTALRVLAASFAATEGGGS